MVGKRINLYVSVQLYQKIQKFAELRELRLSQAVKLLVTVGLAEVKRQEKMFKKLMEEAEEIKNEG